MPCNIYYKYVSTNLIIKNCILFLLIWLIALTRKINNVNHNAFSMTYHSDFCLHGTSLVTHIGFVTECNKIKIIAVAETPSIPLELCQRQKLPPFLHVSLE